jgi:hypothetical protein
MALPVVPEVAGACLVQLSRGKRSGRLTERLVSVTTTRANQLSTPLLLLGLGWSSGCGTAEAPAPPWEVANPLRPIPTSPLGADVDLSALELPPTPERVRLGMALLRHAAVRRWERLLRNVPPARARLLRADSRVDRHRRSAGSAESAADHQPRGHPEPALLLGRTCGVSRGTGSGPHLESA